MTGNSKPFRLIDLEELDDDSGPVISEPPSGGRPSTTRRRFATEPVEQLDLNTATVEELEELPGVGPLRARRIIAWRQRNGRFESLDDLKYVRGLGARSVQDLTPYLVVRDQR